MSGVGLPYRDPSAGNRGGLRAENGGHPGLPRNRKRKTCQPGRGRVDEDLGQDSGPTNRGPAERSHRIQEARKSGSPENLKNVSAETSSSFLHHPTGPPTVGFSVEAIRESGPPTLTGRSISFLPGSHPRLDTDSKNRRHLRGRGRGRG